MAASVYDRKVRDVMSREVVTIHHQDTIHEALTLMTENRVAALPVIEGHERCIGVLSTSDLIDLTREMEHDLSELEESGELNRRWIIDQVKDRVGDQLVREVMTDSPDTCRLETPLTEAASLMRRHRVHRLPVVDAKGKLLGIISTMDILDAFIEGAPAGKK